jgi:hypothetical protein
MGEEIVFRRRKVMLFTRTGDSKAKLGELPSTQKDIV